MKILTAFLLSTALLFGACVPSLALDDDEGPVDPKALKIEITKRAQQVALTKIINKKLLERGFETKSADYLSRVWRSMHFDIETGDYIVPATPTQWGDGGVRQNNLDDALRFAANANECMKDLRTSSCKIEYAMVHGCKFGPSYKAKCEANHNFFKRNFSRMKNELGQNSGADDIFLCMAEGGRGAGVAVFDEDNKTNITKLKFESGEASAKLDKVLADPARKPSPTDKLVRPKLQLLEQTCEDVEAKADDNAKVVWQKNLGSVPPTYITHSQAEVSAYEEKQRVFKNKNPLIYQLISAPSFYAYEDVRKSQLGGLAVSTKRKWKLHPYQAEARTFFDITPAEIAEAVKKEP